MTAKPLLLNQPVTQKGDPPSADLVQVIQQLVREVNQLAAANAALTARIDAAGLPWWISGTNGRSVPKRRRLITRPPGKRFGWLTIRRWLMSLRRLQRVMGEQGNRCCRCCIKQIVRVLVGFHLVRRMRAWL